MDRSSVPSLHIACRPDHYFPIVGCLPIDNFMRKPVWNLAS